MIKIGITGNIGSGKTTVCHIFESIGVPVLYADQLAKDIAAKHPTAKSAIINLLGEEAYNELGGYNSAFVSAQVFQSMEKLEKLNAILHPLVAEASNLWFDEKAKEGHLYGLKEAALLFESGSAKHLDRTVYVYCPLEIRKKRVMLRDSCSSQAFEERNQRQWPESKKRKLADDILYNDGSRSLVKQVWILHQKWMMLYQLKV